MSATRPAPRWPSGSWAASTGWRSKATRPTSRRITRRRAARSTRAIRGPRSVRSSPRTSTCCASGSRTACRRTRSVALRPSLRASSPSRSRPASRSGCSRSVRALGSTCGGTGSTTRTAATRGAARRRSCASRVVGRERLARGATAPPPDGLVVERAGCDPKPIDAIGESGRQKLRSFVWPDQVARLALLDAAIATAREVPATIDQEEAASWLGHKLTTPVSGAATVVFHSVVMQYMNKAAAGCGRASDRRRRQPRDERRTRRVVAHGARLGGGPRERHVDDVARRTRAVDRSHRFPRRPRRVVRPERAQALAAVQTVAAPAVASIRVPRGAWPPIAGQSTW